MPRYLMLAAVRSKLMQRKGLCYLSKLAVGFLMRFPLEVEGASVAQLALQVEGNVVEELPQHAVAEAIVMKIHLHRQTLCHHAILSLVKTQRGSLSRGERYIILGLEHCK